MIAIMNLADLTPSLIEQIYCYSNDMSQVAIVCDDVPSNAVESFVYTDISDFLQTSGWKQPQEGEE